MPAAKKKASKAKSKAKATAKTPKVKKTKKRSVNIQPDYIYDDAIEIRLSKDLRQAALNMGNEEVRYLVDTYYQAQNNRTRDNNRLKALKKAGEPHEVTSFFLDKNSAIENVLGQAIKVWCEQHDVYTGWLKSIVGVGPIISAGFLSELDPLRAKSAGGFWSFCGLDPTKEWKTKTKRPWNAKLKRLAYTFGESVIKFRNNPRSYYGPLFQQYWDRLIEKNEAGEFAETALYEVEQKSVKKTTDAWKWYAGCVTMEEARRLRERKLEEKLRVKKIKANNPKSKVTEKVLQPEFGEPGCGLNMLPPGRILARARRWVAKLFLSNLFDAMYAYETGEQPPRPYILENPDHLGKKHSTLLYPPGLQEFIDACCAAGPATKPDEKANKDKEKEEVEK